MNKFICKHKNLIIVIYLILSIIKFFTVRIDFVREEDPTIYFKLCPSIDNHLFASVENGQLKDYYDNKYLWYKEKQYWEIIHSPGGMQNFIGEVYTFLICCWWVYSTYLISFAIWKIFKTEY